MLQNTALLPGMFCYVVGDEKVSLILIVLCAKIFAL